MNLPSVFIASSSENLDIVEKVQELLQNKLKHQVDIRPWTEEFDLSKVYIESLEKEAGNIDFALLVMAPDDIIISRNKTNPVPRDNVIFELGLFMGFLGRERCFIFLEESSELKLPSDLLGIMAATYKPPKNKKNLGTVIDKACSQISERIIQLGTRRKLSQEKLEAQEAIHIFSDKIEGAWFERIKQTGENVLSFFQIECDPLVNSVRLDGKSYSKKGIQGASWNSTLSRIEIDNNKIVYLWQGSKPTIANVPFHGYGEMIFDKSLKTNGIMVE
jgi:hypothetical protein